MDRRFDTLPSRLKAVSMEMDIADVPCLLVRQDDKPRPFLLWMHGRTADKEFDPGRYLRCVHQGINVCAVDLPGHGDRFQGGMQEKDRILEVMLQMVDEIDPIVAGLSEIDGFDRSRAAIGGMSAGGIVSILRLCREHPFHAAVLEAAMGSWGSHRDHHMFASLTDEQFQALNPIEHLQDWREIPLLAFHNTHDTWIPIDAQIPFIESLTKRYADPDLVELVRFDHTGAPYEHIGFGLQAAFVKEVQVAFLTRHLHVDQEIVT